MRFTITRAVSGFSGEMTHSANPRRRHVVCASGGGVGKLYSVAEATVSTPGDISEPRASALPRCRKYEGWGVRDESVTAIAVSYGFGLCASSAWIWLLRSSYFFRT